ncbi:GNAT family N-acetyltransferase [Alcanivorax sp.]|uniref:GNAT family N-acetyltransferase n=1 Tax=Alcanivorax sp. TaxID=1872427 RepID=UPI00260C4ED1|nr:GNAT family N-acetyltransferase [Alcanivorax sp.]
MTPSITLEPLKPAHTLPLYLLTESNRDYLRQWLPWLDHVRSPDDTAAFIESSMATASSGGAPNFAIVHEGSLCGVAGFHGIDPVQGIGSIGYWLAESYTGKGIVTESVRLLLQIGFDDFDLNKIEIRCAVDNHRSRAIAERLGFTHEATLSQSEWL